MRKNARKKKSILSHKTLYQDKMNKKPMFASISLKGGMRTEIMCRVVVQNNPMLICLHEPITAIQTPS